jgi:hypothetical protein
MKMAMMMRLAPALRHCLCLLIGEPGAMTGSASSCRKLNAVGRPLTLGAMPALHGDDASCCRRRRMVGGAVVVAPAPVVVAPTCVRSRCHGRIYMMLMRRSARTRAEPTVAESTRSEGAETDLA